MKLFGSNTSSYVRKARIQALEGGYWDQIDFFEMATAFWMRRCWRVMIIPSGPNWPVATNGTMDR